MLLYAPNKSVCNINSECLNDMFVKKETSYSLGKTVILIQPKRQTTTYGLRSVSYLGSKLWNDHPFYMTDVFLMTCGPFYKHGLTLIPAWISNYIHYNMWDEITYPFLNFNGATVEV